jgi:hypothetical protein
MPCYTQGVSDQHLTRPSRTDLHGLVERLPESELAAARRFLEFLSLASSGEEEIDVETAAKLDAAIAEGGDPIALDELKRRYRL